MKIILLIPLLFVFASCKKDIDLPTTEASTKTAYIIVNCENCTIDYGMPDQYKGFSNSGGDSQKLSFAYKEGYTLAMNITSMLQEQTLSVKVYTKDSKLVYQSAKLQPTTGYWNLNVLLPAE